MERLCAVLGAQEGHRMREVDLHAELRRRDERWTDEKFQRKLKEAFATGSVNRVSGPAKYLLYSGDERSGGTAGPSLYTSIGRMVMKHGLLGCRCRDREVLLTSDLKSRGKRWAVPDLVLRCHPKVSGQPGAAVMHTIEVETSRGFSIESVYQAHAQGRGADYSWVLFHQGSASNAPIQHPDGERILWAAAQLGIGLIRFSNPRSIVTWAVVRKAERRDGTTAQHRTLAELVRNADRVPHVHR